MLCTFRVNGLPCAQPATQHWRVGPDAGVFACANHAARSWLSEDRILGRHPAEEICSLREAVWVEGEPSRCEVPLLESDIAELLTTAGLIEA